MASTDPSDLVLDLEQVEPAVHLLSATIAENISDTQSKHFAEQLLHITTNYLHQVVRNLTVARQQLLDAGKLSQRLEGSISEALKKFTGYIESLRFYMQGVPGKRKMSSERETAIASAPNPRDNQYKITRSQRQVIARWERMTEQETLTDGIQRGQIPLLQAYLQNRGGTKTAVLPLIVDHGLHKALDYLQRKEMKEAGQMLANLGFDVWSKLHQICMFTSNRQLRDYLLTELTDAGHLSEEERSMVKFVHKLESLYSCPSFDVAKLLRTEAIGQHSQHECSVDISTLLGTSKADELVSECKDIAVVEVSNSETASYSHVLLDWVKTWDQETRDRVLLERMLHRRDLGASKGEHIEASTLWSYLTSHQDIEHLKEWVERQYGSKTLSSQPTWPFHLPLNPTLLDKTEQCTELVKNELLNLLASRGVFSPSEMRDFPLLLHRLSRIHRVIEQPHLLEKRPDTHVMDLAQFHRQMITYCIESHQPQLLYFCLDFWKLCMTSSDLAELGQDQDAALPPWVDMILHFRKAANMTLDPQYVFEASLSAHMWLEKLNSCSVSQMLDQGLVGRALATLMFSPTDLNQIIKGPTEKEGLRDKLENCLKTYPRLYHAFFSRQNTCVVGQDISVYKLLQENIPFEIRRLFGWQRTNTLAGDDALPVMPHFSQEELVEKYAHVEKLQFTYYLRQGRPCFAFCALIISVIQSGHKAISTKRMNTVCMQVQRLAVKYFHQTSVAAACVAFMEVLGQDSSGLRILLQVATLILSHRSSQLQGAIEQRKQAEAKLQIEIGEQLSWCLRKKKRHCMDVLAMLEKAIIWQLDKYRVRVTSFAACQYWLLADLFCYLHHLPLSIAFLTECAKENDWVMFITYAQLHQYPKERVAEVVSSFSASHLSEHMLYVVENVALDMNLEKSPDISPNRSTKDVRAQLYSKIGVTKRKEEESSSSSDSVEESEDMSSMQESGDLILPPESHSKDVFSLLLACLDVPQPDASLLVFSIRHRNPVLAVLAACFQEKNSINCLCSWLLASCKPHTHHRLREAHADAEQKQWTNENLMDVVMALVKDGSIKTVLQGFKIFEPTSPLVPFLEFLFAVNKDRFAEECRDPLDHFRQVHHKLKTTRQDLHIDVDTLDIDWIEELVNTMLLHFLQTSDSSIVGAMLQHLDQSKAMRLFSKTVGNISRLHQLHQCLVGSQVEINHASLLRSETAEFRKECDRVVTELVKRKLYNEARLFAGVAKAGPEEDITISQLTEELKDLKSSAAWQSESGRCLFWTHCLSLLSKYSTKPYVATRFLQNQIDDCSSYIEKSHLCQLVYDWMCKHKVNDAELKFDVDSLFIQIWKSKIDAHLTQQEVEHKTDAGPDSPLNAVHEMKKELRTKKEPRLNLLKYTKVPKPTDVTKVSLTSEEKEAFDVLLGQLLDDGHVAQSCQLANQFGHYDQDLALVVSCLDLATNVKHVNQLDLYIKQLMASKSASLAKRRKSSFSMVSLPRLGSSIRVESLSPHDDVDGPVDDVLASIEILCSKVVRGQQCCDSILTSYRISKVIKKSFKWVVEQDECTVLRHLLGSEHLNQFVLAKSFITTFVLSDNEVASFLSDSILEALQVYSGLKEPMGSSRLLLHPGSSGGFEGMTQLLQLCTDPSKLGQKLVDAMTTFSTSNIDVNPKILSVEVELLIYAHDCHTLACSMEGIAALLRAAQSLVETLHNAEEYNLMIRLLTGVGRFSEMTYIFDILKQEHQFELLIRKGIDKEEKLRMSILDYLQRYHPDDTETYTMVSLYFSMNRQIANMLENTAQKHLAALKGKAMENTMDMQTTLQNILQYYSDAAESYVKEDCLRHAEMCVKKARLVALQIQMLPTGQRLLNLNKEQISKFIAKHEKFWECFIVAEGYGHKNEWAAAINRQFVQNSNFKFLTDLKNHVTLTPAMISEVAERFRSDASHSKQAVANMKKLLDQCPDVTVSYRVANDLGISDYTRDLIKSDSGAYLQDALSVQY